jgi:hypothetical protein
MDSLEHKLASMKLTAPSERLDQRLDETFSAVRSTSRRTRKVGFLWWAGVMTAAVAVAAALLLRPAQLPPNRPQPAVYRIEATGGLRDMLLNSPANQVEPTHFELRGSEQ